jgi:hypothetical protein
METAAADAKTATSTADQRGELQKSALRRTIQSVPRWAKGVIHPTAILSNVSLTETNGSIKGSPSRPKAQFANENHTKAHVARPIIHG